jgi:hypothetical protein
VTALLFGVCFALAGAVWTAYQKVQDLEQRTSRLEDAVNELRLKQSIPAYEWDENIEPPKL